MQQMPLCSSSPLVCRPIHTFPSSLALLPQIFQCISVCLLFSSLVSYWAWGALLSLYLTPPRDNHPISNPIPYVYTLISRTDSILLPWQQSHPELKLISPKAIIIIVIIIMPSFVLTNISSHLTPISPRAIPLSLSERYQSKGTGRRLSSSFCTGGQILMYL